MKKPIAPLALIAAVLVTAAATAQDARFSPSALDRSERECGIL